MARKLPPELLEPIIQKSAAGAGFREISAWLLTEHGVSINYSTLARTVAKEGAARSVAAKSVARTKLAKSVTSDLDRLELFARKAMRIAKTCEGDPEVWVKVARELRGLLTEKLRLAGAGSEDEASRRVVTLADVDTALANAARNAGGTGQ